MRLIEKLTEHEKSILNITEQCAKIEGFLSGMALVSLLTQSPNTDCVRDIYDIRRQASALKDQALKMSFELEDLKNKETK